MALVVSEVKYSDVFEIGVYHKRLLKKSAIER